MENNYIEDDSPRLGPGDLEVGELLMFRDSLFMVTNERNTLGEVKCVDLATGCLVYIHENIMIEEVEGKLVLGREVTQW